MPRGDRTGPMGMGSMTGRGAGYCAGYSVPGYMNPFMGRGVGWGRGFRLGRGYGASGGRRIGFGWGRRQSPGMADWVAPYQGYAPYPPPAGVAYGPPTRERELEMLQSQAEEFQDALQDIQRRISELSSEDKQNDT